MATGTCLVGAVLPAFLASQTAHAARTVDLKGFGAEFHVAFSEPIKVENVPGSVAAAEKTTVELIKRASPSKSSQQLDALTKDVQSKLFTYLKQLGFIAAGSFNNLNIGDIVRVLDDGDILEIRSADEAFEKLQPQSFPTFIPTIEVNKSDSSGTHTQFSLSCRNATERSASPSSLLSSIKSETISDLADQTNLVVQSVLRCTELTVDDGNGPQVFRDVTLGFRPAPRAIFVPTQRS